MCSIALSALLAVNYVDPQPADLRALVDRLRVGDPASVPREWFGPPDRVARQILFRHHVEQWVYTDRISLRIEFDCPPGEEARIVRIWEGAESQARTEPLFRLPR